MTTTIALSGKGGTGKSSIASLVIRYLLINNLGPVLAIDADANANLGEGLGIKVERTIGEILANFNVEKLKIPSGITKDAYLILKLNEAISESKGVDLITMGRGEGRGCYCYPNNVLRNFIDQLNKNYPFIVIDNEAGLEHLSRGTTDKVDELFLVSDHSIKGVRTLKRILDLTSELELDIMNRYCVMNMIPNRLDTGITMELEKLDIQLAALIPFDESIQQFDLIQRSLLELPVNSPAVRAIDKLLLQFSGIGNFDQTSIKG
jgi:CO dehydrogenase maturation factor